VRLRGVTGRDDAPVDDAMPGATPDRRREQRGWYVYDWANSAFSTTVVTTFLGPYLTTVTEDAAGADGRVPFLLGEVRPGQYFGYVLSISVVLQVLVLPVVGAVADHSHRKKELLGLFAYVGASATVLMFFLQGDRYVLGGVLLVVANLAFGASVVVYNAFLPQISTPDERDRVSSRGWALGYSGGALLLAANLALYLAHDSFGLTEGQAVRVSLLSAGLWWAGFTIIPLRRLRNRGVTVDHDGSVLVSGFRQLGRTMREMGSFPKTLLFLLAYLIYNDGIQTVIATAGIYIEKELGLDTGVTVAVVLLVQVVAFVGALLLGRLAGRFGAKRVILGSLVVWAGLVGFAYSIPAGQVAPVFLLAAGIGLVLGGSQALSRSLFSQLIPRDREAEYFSFYEISERGTSWLGTATFSLVFGVTGSYRSAVVVLVAFFVVGGTLLALVRVREAIEAVGNPQPRVV
jgi:UMF1 family MFS transporter